MGFSFLAGSEETKSNPQTVESQFEGIKYVDSELEKQEKKDDKLDQKLEQKINPTESPLTKSSEHGKGHVQVEYTPTNNTRDFADLAVVQRTLLPKSLRWYYSLGGALIPNDVFFKTLGADGRLGFFLDETWGVELQAVALTSLQGQDLQELQGNQNVTVQNLVSLQRFFGADLIWTPFYGKTALLNRKIFPLEIYGVVGLDAVTTAGTSNALGYKFGLGEIFATSKRNSVRVEISYLFYNSLNILNQNQSANSIVLNFNFQQFITNWTSR